MKPVSPALRQFAESLQYHNSEQFDAAVAVLSSGGRGERSVLFALADEARLWAAAGLEARGHAADAATLRALAPIVDQSTARAAGDALPGSTIPEVDAATACARAACTEAASEDKLESMLVGTLAAKSAIELAKSYPDAKKAGAYMGAKSFLARMSVPAGVELANAFKQDDDAD